MFKLLKKFIAVKEYKHFRFQMFIIFLNPTI